MKIEHDCNMQDHMPSCRVEELGGYDTLMQAHINGDEPLLNQPPWRLAFIKNHNHVILEYATAPHSYHIDPTYCPIKWQNTWANFDTMSEYYPEPMNFLELPLADCFCTKNYFTSCYS